jgi:hypothetical protein
VGLTPLYDRGRPAASKKPAAGAVHLVSASVRKTQDRLSSHSPSGERRGARPEPVVSRSGRRVVTPEFRACAACAPEIGIIGTIGTNPGFCGEFGPFFCPDFPPPVRKSGHQIGTLSRVRYSTGVRRPDMGGPIPQTGTNPDRVCRPGVGERPAGECRPRSIHVYTTTVAAKSPASRPGTRVAPAAARPSWLARSANRRCGWPTPASWPTRAAPPDGPAAACRRGRSGRAVVPGGEFGAGMAGVCRLQVHASVPGETRPPLLME